MRTPWKAGILGVLLVVAGCGPAKGDKHEISISMIYFDLKDAEGGGEKSRWATLTSEGKAMYISNCGVKVVTPGKEWTKVEVLNGTDEGASGWIETEKLK